MEKRLGPLLAARWKVLAFNSKKQTICILVQFSTERWLKELIEASDMKIHVIICVTVQMIQLFGL